ncbi:hypothetical protein D9615_004080 [Tricholomella constricta]|uniref:Uncharacterized protein n=1 Tax=Tricholomella constricta TaxID=117010 RepID=A0A8H5HCN6_9AGAR|nr:hypothetical protein D9615_004080 [Tricholomella constricta]
MPISAEPKFLVYKEETASFNVTIARNFSLSSELPHQSFPLHPSALTETITPTDTDTIPADNAKNQNMNPAISGIIGAACTLAFALVVGIIVAIWRRHRRRNNTERSSYMSFYKTQLETSTSSYAGLRSVIDEDVKSPSRGPALTLRTEPLMELGRVGASENQSLLSLPDNLYVPASII